MAQNRVPAIDIMKFIAVFLVMNSHMEICYPRFQFLATGGGIGDALFFFASGFTLFLGRDVRFDQWYKRRINRIYPSILAAAIVAYLIWGFEENIGDILIGKRYWFIGCIMIYYMFLYPLKKIKNKKVINWVFAGWLIAMIVAFFVIWGGTVSLYSKGLYRCLFFFLFMLQGAIMGKYHDSFSCKWWHLPTLIAATGLWFFLLSKGTGNSLLIISVFPLLYVTYSLYCVCNARFLTNLYETKVGGGIMFIISQLCLEVYLIQKFVFTDTLNTLFPLNVPVIMILVIITAYSVKLVAGFISQTFRAEPYEWNKMLLYKRKLR